MKNEFEEEIKEPKINFDDFLIAIQKGQYGISRFLDENLTPENAQQYIDFIQMIKKALNNDEVAILSLSEQQKEIVNDWGNMLEVAPDYFKAELLPFLDNIIILCKNSFRVEQEPIPAELYVEGFEEVIHNITKAIETNHANEIEEILQTSGNYLGQKFILEQFQEQSIYNGSQHSLTAQIVNYLLLNYYKSDVPPHPEVFSSIDGAITKFLTTNLREEDLLNGAELRMSEININHQSFAKAFNKETTELVAPASTYQVEGNKLPIKVAETRNKAMEMMADILRKSQDGMEEITPIEDALINDIFQELTALANRENSAELLEMVTKWQHSYQNGTLDAETIEIITDSYFNYDVMLPTAGVEMLLNNAGIPKNWQQKLYALDAVTKHFYITLFDKKLTPELQHKCSLFVVTWLTEMYNNEETRAILDQLLSSKDQSPELPPELQEKFAEQVLNMVYA